MPSQTRLLNFSPPIDCRRFVVNVHANYHDWAGAAMELLKKYATSQQQIDAVLGGTAMRVYRIKSD